MMVAIPCPPPMQRVMRAARSPLRSSSSSAVPSSMAPVAPKGMTERDRRSVYVHFLRVQIQVAHYLHPHNAECLVYPPQVDVPRRHALLIQRFDRGRRRRGQHYNGLRALALPPAQCMSAGPRRTGSYIFEDEQSATYKIVEEAPNGPHIRLPSG